MLYCHNNFTGSVTTVRPVWGYIVTITPPVVLQLSDPFEGYIVTITSPVVLQLSDPLGDVA